MTIPGIYSFAHIPDSAFSVWCCDGCGGEDVSLWTKSGVAHYKGQHEVCGLFHYVKPFDRKRSPQMSPEECSDFVEAFRTRDYTQTLDRDCTRVLQCFDKYKEPLPVTGLMLLLNMSKYDVLKALGRLQPRRTDLLGQWRLLLHTTMSLRLLNYLRRQGLTKSIRVVKAGQYLGVTFQLRNGTSYSSRLDDSPIDTAFVINWPHKRALLYRYHLETSFRIANSTPEQKDDFIATVLIHELGHLCATTKSPSFCTEYDFLGWEWTLARELDLEKEWETSLYKYGLGQGAPTMDPPKDPQKFHSMLGERYDHAIHAGLITKTGVLCTLVYTT